MTPSAHDRLAENRARDMRGRRAAEELSACEPVSGDGGSVSIRCTGAAPDIAKLIDHTLLKPDATAAQIRGLCAEAREYRFATVCVNPTWVPLCAELLEGSGVGVTTVVGFPLGATSTPAKVFEARQAIADGADEIDMVLNIGALKSGDDRRAQEDVGAVATECHAQGALLKVILENGYLTDEEKVRACQICVQAGADYVKTATGFGAGGATPADVALMRAAVGDAAEVKAAGGIRTLADAYAVVKAGATRIGASAGVKLVQGVQGQAAAPDSTGSY